MNPNHQDEVRWVAWVIGVVLAPLMCNIAASPFAGAFHTRRELGSLAGVVFVLWVLSIAFVSFGHSRAIARKKGMTRLLPRLLLWSLVTILGIVVSAGIWAGTCAILSQR